MTGLDPEKDTILSIACFVTDYKLNPLDPSGLDIIIHHPKSALDRMDSWCTHTHGASGLTAAVLRSHITSEQAARSLLSYITSLVPTKGVALLAGNSVHADKMFLMKRPFDRVLAHLHYRILDVSAIKEGVRRWSPLAVLEEAPAKQGKHEARADILESIEEARFYKKLFERMQLEEKIGG